MADSVCLHCERRPSADRLGLCTACHARPCVRVLYAVRRHGWTPAWEAHLRRLAERAKKGLPLFDDDGPREAEAETRNDHRRMGDLAEELIPPPEMNDAF